MNLSRAEVEQEAKYQKPEVQQEQKLLVKRREKVMHVLVADRPDLFTFVAEA